MPLTPAQLAALVASVGVGLQRIQDELGRDGPGGRVRFPTGYLKTVAERTPNFPWIGDEALKRNLCYHFIFSDVLRWLLNRTALTGIARDMVIKHVIAVMGTIAESVTVAAMKRLGHGKSTYVKRAARLFRLGAIEFDVEDELRWLWDARASVHVYEAAGLEIGQYDVAHSNRAILAVRALCDQLNEYFLVKLMPAAVSPGVSLRV